MSSKKRVFATNNIINYNDLYQLKSGCEILKTVKNEDNNAILKQFKNYNQWQILNKAYYTFIDNDAIEVNNVRDLYNSNNSYSNSECENEYYNDCNECDNKYYNDCNECDKKCNKSCKCEKKCNNNDCNNELYFKGKIIVKKTIPQQFPSNILMCKWCNNSKLRTEDILHHSLKKNKIHEICKCKCKCLQTKPDVKYSSCSLCKNAKQLFI